jgi:hypothetical protein
MASSQLEDGHVALRSRTDHELRTVRGRKTGRVRSIAPLTAERADYAGQNAAVAPRRAHHLLLGPRRVNPPRSRDVIGPGHPTLSEAVAFARPLARGGGERLGEDVFLGPGANRRRRPHGRPAFAGTAGDETSFWRWLSGKG